MATSRAYTNLLTGRLSDTEFTKVIDLLKEHVTDGMDIADYMQANYDNMTATVTNTTTLKQEVRADRRKGSRVTFGMELTHLLANILVPCMGDYFYFTDVECHYELPIEPGTHGDILYYREGDEFKWHRDAIPECPLPKPDPSESKDSEGASAEWQYFTLLVGLDTTVKGGETAIVDEDDKIHKFTSGCTKDHFLLFRSDQMHSGYPVVKGHKLSLKIDFWILTNDFKTFPEEMDDPEYPEDEYEPDSDDGGWCNEDPYDDYY